MLNRKIALSFSNMSKMVGIKSTAVVRIQGIREV